MSTDRPTVEPRVRFTGFKFERELNHRCYCEITLERPDGQAFSGTENAVGDGPAELRCIASATVRALEAAIGSPETFEVLGVKAIKAFDTSVVLVAMSARRGDNVQRLVGSYLATDDTERGAALAVLNATNRYLGNTVFSR
jgi:hypothetical protein